MGSNFVTSLLSGIESNVWMGLLVCVCWIWIPFLLWKSGLWKSGMGKRFSRLSPWLTPAISLYLAVFFLGQAFHSLRVSRVDAWAIVDAILGVLMSVQVVREVREALGKNRPKADTLYKAET